ncbi:hypothetical protein ABIE09_003240 [Lysobacter enzymogenes]
MVGLAGSSGGSFAALHRKDGACRRLAPRTIAATGAMRRRGRFSIDTPGVAPLGRFLPAARRDGPASSLAAEGRGAKRIRARVPHPPVRCASLRMSPIRRRDTHPCAPADLPASPRVLARSGPPWPRSRSRHRAQATGGGTWEPPIDPEPHRNSPQRRCRQPKRQGLPWRCIARPMRVSTKTMLRRRNGGDKRCGTKRTAATTNCTRTSLRRGVCADALRFRSVRRPSMAVARWPRTAQRGCSSARTASR